MKFELDLKYNLIRLYIDNTIHVLLDRTNFIGFQSWIEDDKYIIEYYTTKQVITTEYNNIKKWKQILKLLDKRLPELWR